MTLKHSLAAVLAVFAGAIALGGCTHPLDSYERLTAPDLTKPYIGRTKAEIVTCAGQPHSRISKPGGEILIYRYSGTGPVPGGTPKDWSCSATMEFTGDRLEEISYAPKDVESPYTEFGKKKPNLPHCTFSLPRCRGA
ncbi:hypothetical protein A7A08_01341 [Methyloligella halotolerans]|uniref:Uncharacterized protein n=1 Tax=Methyloligella halotolerans TaxID=1177755 RepID=A0A1E2S195_9HYPH|nr:hypothetical protein [Methyloligella halotolerans]ODA68170.1 hypothetical protein A7A08_01341 [Methyloligella halotolerans]